jgi:hypothetical protein
LVRIRADNGDVLGAKSMAENAPSPEAKLRCLQEVALVQATSGDIDAAAETALHLPSRLQQRVLEAIGLHQVALGDLDAALKTAQQMERGQSDNLLFAIAEAFDERGNKAKAKQIASRMADTDMAKSVGAAEIPSQSASIDACDIAWKQANSGDSKGALHTLVGAKCECKSAAYIHERAGDAAGAALAVRSCENPSDVSAGMAELAKRSAESGDIPSALSFASSVDVAGAYRFEEYLAPALREIARYWALKDRTAALEWAESRPDGYQRAMALLGVAESYRSSAIDEGKKPQPPPPSARKVDH